MLWTEDEVRDHYKRLGWPAPNLRESDRVGLMYTVTNSPRPKKPAIEPLSGPLDATLVLWGHCPSKKSNYRVSGSGKLISDAATKSQINVLTMQAMLQWAKISSVPVEHPEVTTTFYIRSGRSDEDGKYVTLMDVLQHAGVIFNDNCKRFNGRKIHEPCVFVEESEERVEIRLVKR